jgi:hypothetical protein
MTGGAMGELTFDEALTQLLLGTGLTYRYLEDRAVMIVPISRTNAGQSGGALDTESPGHGEAPRQPMRCMQIQSPAPYTILARGYSLFPAGRSYVLTGSVRKKAIAPDRQTGIRRGPREAARPAAATVSRGPAPALRG